MSQKDSSDDVVKEWFGQLPEGWSLRRLRTLGHFTASGIDKKTVEGESLVRMVNYTDIYGNPTLELRNSPDYMVVSCPANKVEEHGLVQGDMLFTPSSETAEDIGVSAVVMEDLLNTVYSYHITRFRMRDEISLRYRKYLCNHPRVLRQFSRLCKGTTRQILVREDFKSAWVAIPPTEQHDRIAEYLNEATGKVDRLVALRRRQMELLQEQRAALIQQAVTRGLNPRAPLKDSGLPWLGEIPKHWEVVKFNHYVSLRHGHQFRQEDFTPVGCKVIKITQLNADGTLDIENCDTVASERVASFRDILIKSGDILMALTGGTIGKVIRVGEVTEPLLQNYRVGHFAPSQKAKLTKDFLYWVMKSDVAMGQILFLVSETGQPNIGKADFSGVFFALPPLREQTEIVEHISNELPKLDALHSAYTHQLELLTEYRAALIHECVTGQRAVPTN